MFFFFRAAPCPLVKLCLFIALNTSVGVPELDGRYLGMGIALLGEGYGRNGRG